MNQYIKSYQLFESNKDRETVEDCFLEITDSYPGSYLEEYKPGRIIKFVSEILGESLSCVTEGTYRRGEIRYQERKWIRNDWCIIEDETSQGLYPTRQRLKHDRSYQVMSDFVRALPSVLVKLIRFVIGDKEIKFTINMYSVERGTCIVFYLEY
jgi:hypothetical protein